MCGLLSNGTVQCTGNSTVGQLGMAALDAENPDDVALTVVPGVNDAIAVTTSGAHVCVLRQGGTVACWGFDSSGEIGDVSPDKISMCRDSHGSAILPCVVTPADVPGVQNATAISAGFGYTCALLADGTVTCWGNPAYDGSDPQASDVRNPTPSVVPKLSGVSAIATGSVGSDGLPSHICALLSNETVECWGSNADGALGDGTTQDSAIPVVVH